MRNGHYGYESHAHVHQTCERLSRKSKTGVQVCVFLDSNATSHWTSADWYRTFSVILVQRWESMKSVALMPMSLRPVWIYSMWWTNKARVQVSTLKKMPAWLSSCSPWLPFSLSDEKCLLWLWVSCPCPSDQCKTESWTEPECKLRCQIVKGTSPLTLSCSSPALSFSRSDEKVLCARVSCPCLSDLWGTM